MEQRSPEWFAARVGKITASRMGDLNAKTKTGWGSSRANYIAELVAERLTGKPYPKYESTEMRWGTEHETEARKCYEFENDVDVIETGFLEHPGLPMCGGSPDGLIGSDGLLEIKCPNTKTHIETLLTRTVPKEYLLQIQWNLDVTLRDWADFVSYDPRMPGHMAMVAIRVPRDQNLICELITSARDALADINKTVSRLRGIYEAAP